MVAVGGGAFDLTGLTRVAYSQAFQTFVTPAEGNLWMGAATEYKTFANYLGITGPASFGSGGFTHSLFGTGDAVWLRGGGGPPFGTSIGVAFDYVSGTALASAATWKNASFASLGVDPGTYVWTWGNGAEQSFTLQIGPLGPGGDPRAVMVPEPAAAGTFGFGAALVCGCVALRRRKPGAERGEG